MSALYARRQQARRRRSLARLDVGLGLLIAAVAFILGPGIAIVAIIALIALAICAVSILLERRRVRRRGRLRSRGAAQEPSSNHAQGRRR